MMTADEAGSGRGSDGLPLVVLLPVYNDWESLAAVLEHLDRVLEASGIAAQVVVVDDASTEAPSRPAMIPDAKAITEVWRIALFRNLGHQRAIAIGLAWVDSNLPCSAVVVMDGDGEDDPADVPRLVAACQAHENRAVVFAGRARRSEGLGFKLAYAVFKMVHRILVGRKIRFGNFSVVPRPLLARLASVSELWNHYAAGVLRARLPYVEVPTQRARRISGSSKMSFVSLVTHGLSAMSVSGEIVGTRLLFAATLLVAAGVIGILTVVIIKFATDWAIPGWATFTVALVFILMVQAIMAALLFAFVTLSARSGLGFLPRRDHGFFIMSVDRAPVRAARPGARK